MKFAGDSREGRSDAWSALVASLSGLSGARATRGGGLGWILVLAVGTALAAGWLGCASSSGGDAPGEPPAMTYAWRLPIGMPVPLVPRDNPMSEAKVELGRRLFYDSRLSGNQSFSCASCHQQALAFTDGKPRAVGSTGEVHPRATMSLANVAYNRSFNWGDPEKRRLEEQMLVPMFATEPVELGLAGLEEELVRRLMADAVYPQLFAAAYPSQPAPISVDTVVAAIASFERTLVSGDSAYDRLLFWGDDSEFSSAARRGMELFFSERTNCGRCHASFNLSGAIEFEGAAPVRPDFHNTGLYNLDGRGAYPERNRGVFEFTGKANDMGRFRPPSLRNIEVTAPYMHDGSIATLDAVIDHYAAGGRAGKDHPLKSDLVKGFEIDDGEKADLVEFLRSLTDRQFLSDERYSNPFSGLPDSDRDAERRGVARSLLR